MTRVIVTGELFLVFCSGCVTHRSHLSHTRDYIPKSVLTDRCNEQAPAPLAVESEEIRLRRLEAFTTTVIVVGRVAYEIIRVIR